MLFVLLLASLIEVLLARKLVEKLLTFIPVGKDVHLKELAKGGSVAFFLKIGSALVIYLFQFVIAKFYGPEGNGLFSYCFAVLNIMVIISIFGLETYLVRIIADFASRAKWYAIRHSYLKALLLAFIVSLVFSGVTYLGMPALMNIAGKMNYESGLRITAMALIPATILRLNAEALKGLKKITQYSLLQNISILGFATIGMLFLEIFDHQMENIIWGLLFGEIVMMTWSFFLWKRQIGTFKNKEETGDLLSTKYMVKTSLPFLLTSATFFLMNWTDKIMLGFMETQARLGIYEIALKIANLGTLIIFAVNTIAAPKFSEFYWNQEMEQFKKFTYQTTLANFSLTLPIVGIIFLFPNFILGIFGESFLAGQTSLYFLTAGCFVNAGVGSVIVILNMTGKQKTSLIIFSTVGVFNLLANYLLIPYYGIQGAAFSTMISMALWNLGGMLFIYKYYGFWTINFPALIKRG